MQIYGDVSDFLNKSKADCLVYSDFVERIPKYFRDYPERRKLYDTKGEQKAKLTTSDMIDYCDRGLEFKICRAEDINLIREYLSMYIDQMSVHEEEMKKDNKHRDMLLYLEKARRFYNILVGFEKSTNRAVLQHAKIDPDEHREVSAESVVSALSSLF